ncbi:MAG: hypothetical protein L6Q47_12310 [Ignavibacteriaceae bacterium]|nr:hypothetical protein [Ignavibacteriaceae bacterium]
MRLVRNFNEFLRIIKPGAALALLILILQGCEVKNPIMPSWDVDLTVPVVDREFNLQSVIDKDSSVLRAYDDPSRLGLLYYGEVSDISPIVVGDKLRMSPIGLSTGFTIGAIKVNQPAPVSVSIPVSEFVPGATGGQPFLFPPVASQSVSKSLPPIDAFEEAVFESGNLELHFDNNNGVTITINSVTFKNTATGAVIPQLTSNTPLNIPQGQRGTKVFPLAGAVVPKGMTIDIVLSSPGSGGNVITLPANAGTAVEAQFTNFSLSQVTAPLPAQDPVSFDSTFVLDDSSSFAEIVIDQGQLNLTLSNTLDVGVIASLTINNLRKPDNTPFTASPTLGRVGSGSETQTVTVSDLHDWRIVSGSGGSTLTNRLSFSVTVNTIPSADPRTIRTTDNISVDVTMSELVLKSINGRFKPTPLDFAATSIPIKLGTFTSFNASQLVFEKFGLVLNINSTTTEELGFSGTITGKNSSRTQVVNIPYTVIHQNANTITLSDQELRDFINAFASAPPDSIILKYNAILNPDYKVGAIAATDSLYGNSDIEVPIKLGIGGGQFTDTSEVNIDESNRENLDNLLSASISMSIENGLPLGISVVSDFYDENGNLLFRFPPNRAPNPATLNVLGGLVDVNGKVTTPRSNTFTLQVNQDEFSKLTLAKKIVSTVSINTTGVNALPVQFRTNDKIKLKGFGLVQYRVKP